MSHIIQEDNIDPLGIVVPHAGYIYSGEVAAYNFSLLKNKHYDTIIILGTSHHYLENVVSIYDGNYYQTPLGDVEIDSEITGKIIEAHNRFVFHEDVHNKEHSIEAQLPFLQYQLPNFKIVPILTSTHDLPGGETFVPTDLVFPPVYIKPGVTTTTTTVPGTTTTTPTIEPTTTPTPTPGFTLFMLLSTLTAVIVILRRSRK